jgi:hypothetical protein
MCTADGTPGSVASGSVASGSVASGNAAPGSIAPGNVAEALRSAVASLDYLITAAPGLPAAGCGEALASLGGVQARLAAARSVLLRRFDALDGHAADGYGSASAWLAAMARMSGRDAKAAVRQMRQLSTHPDLESGLARGDVSESWAGEIAGWLRKLPQELRAGTQKILAEAAAAGASLEDLATITAHALTMWQEQHPDPDDDDGGFGDRYLTVGTTFGGAGVIRGDLTPGCAAAVTAVLEAFGKKAGPEDDRTQAQRFHDGLQQACEVLLRSQLVPDRAGAATQVIAHIPLSQLRALAGASRLEDARISALLGEDGYLPGNDAEAAACDATTVPVVTGTTDLTAVDEMIAVILASLGLAGSAAPGPDRTAGPGQHSPAAPGSRDGGLDGRAALAALSPQARQALRHAIARLAIDLVSGPGGTAAALRTGLLEHPWNTPSLPLDIGYADTIPAHIRRAVNLRDKHCRWPRCRRPAAWCDIHHLVHKGGGGETSVRNCALLCQFHHDVCIHRWGWQFVLHPDGTTSAYGPRGQALHSHSPPLAQAG